MATGYTAPLRDMRFVLEEVIGLDALSKLDGLEQLTPILVGQVLDEAGKFASEVFAPLNQPGDLEGAQLVNGVVRMPDGVVEAYGKWCEAGWPSVAGNVEHGGMGLGVTMATAIGEMWQSANMGLADGLMLSQGAIEAIEAHGTPEQKAKYLPKLISGEWAGTMNLTEPNAGSDVGALKSRAMRDGERWRVTGTKIFITHGDQDMSENIIHLVLARTQGAPEGVKGISLFIVPKVLVNNDGSLGQHNDLRPVSLEHKMGHMASPTCVMSYGDDGGAHAELIGGEQRGIQCMFTMMNSARLSVGVQGLAIAERAYQAALDYARDRVQGTMIGERSDEAVAIIRHPDVRCMLMDMRSQIEAMRLLCYSLASALDAATRKTNPEARARAQGYADLITPVVKGWCTDQGFAVASIGVQVHGGIGYIEEMGAAQHLRDARITMIYEGTNGIQALDLVRRKLQHDGGDVARAMIEEMRETARTCSASDHEALIAIGSDLSPAIDALAATTKWIAETFRADPVAAASGATRYMRMLGWITGGWQLAKSAQVADSKIDHFPDDEAFYTAKLDTARHYASQYLAPAAAEARPIMAAKATVMAIPEAEL
ncbi:MAG: acyl-CoA dehydrogenase [Alphaproteobacteria bacterium]|nr:acyl-CoA dehydrogenase [Alphaproteobacteria bacterium]